MTRGLKVQINNRQIRVGSIVKNWDLTISEQLKQPRYLRQKASSNIDVLESPNKVQITIWAILLIVAASISLLSKPDILWGGTAHWGMDEKSYVILAHSLVYSDKFGLMHTPGEPDSSPFQIGYPLLVAPFVLLFPENPDAVRMLPLFAVLLNATLLFWGWRWLSRRSYWWGISIVGLYILSPPSFQESQRLLAEPVFLTFVLGTVLLAEQARWGQQKRWWSAAVTITLTLAILIRAFGILLIPGMFAYLLYVKGKGFWKELLRIVLQMIILVSVFIAIAPAGTKDGLLPARYYNQSQGGSTFLHTLAVTLRLTTPDDLSTTSASAENIVKDDLLIDGTTLNVTKVIYDSVVQGIHFHVTEHLLKAFFPSRGEALAQRLGISIPILLSYLVFGLIIIGFVRWFTLEGLSLFGLFAILYAGILLLWVWQQERFLYPIQPQLHFGFLLGIEAVLLGSTRFINLTNSPRRLVNGLLTVVVVFLTIALTLKSWIVLADRVFWVDDLHGRTSWLKSNTPVSAVVMTEEPEIEFLYSNRKTVLYPEASSSDSELYDYLVKNNVDYILIAPQIIPSKRWQPTPIPQYSESTAHILPLLAELSVKESVAEVYHSEPDLVKIFKVPR